jgi:hypothetical protein
MPSDAQASAEPPSVEPPPFVDAQAFDLPPAFVETPRLEPRADAASPAGDDDPRGTPVPPAIDIGIDTDAELVAPAFEVIERDTRATEAELAPGPAFYTEPPTFVGTLSVDSTTRAPTDVYLGTEPPPTIASGVELPPEHDDPAGSVTIATDRAEESAPSAALAAAPSEGAHAGESAEPGHVPNGVANGVAVAPEPANRIQPPAAPAPPPPSAPVPQVPGLVLIETDTPIRYVYWELATSGLGTPHWIHVVSHTPTPGGDTERHERHFPVHRQLGALRLEGVPPQAVLRARLTHANDAHPLVVAGAVRPRAPGAEPFEIRYTPHPSAKPEALASRAQALLERASPVYWDNI